MKISDYVTQVLHECSYFNGVKEVSFELCLDAQQFVVKESPNKIRFTVAIPLPTKSDV